MRKVLLGAVLVLVAAGLAWGGPPAGALPARVLRWFDGDTAQIRFTGDVPRGLGTHEVVRLLGINTPEVGEPLAEEATRLFRTLTMGRAVYVELNPWEGRDLHSRLLAYLWVEGDEGWVLVNEALLRAGLARLLVYYPDQEGYYCRFLHALALAQRDKLGLWAKFSVPLPLEEVERSPVGYVTEAITVVFTVARLSADRQGLSLWAAGSRYGFRAILDPGLCHPAWEGHPLPGPDLVGRRVAVTGELLWDSFGGGPRIVVRFPELLELWSGEGSSP
ncbi:MAG: thermonuclease family protein [Candidatus Bipolaricaulota bacterium]|nr:thermonuclease family protein [Candidatus Bipolaricaulota bacterium]